MGRAIEMKVSAKQRRELESIVARPTEAAGLVRRARVVLLSGDGESGPVEYRFKIMDRWSRRVFNALLRRYGLRPYRYTGQHEQSVMVGALSRTALRPLRY